MRYCMTHDIFKVVMKNGNVVCPRCEIANGNGTEVNRRWIVREAA